MPKKATGHVRWVNGVAIARISVTTEKRRSFAMPTCKTEAEAADRAKLIAEIAQRLRMAPIAQDLVHKALDLVATTPARSLSSALKVVDGIAGREVAPAGSLDVPTFQQIGEDWTSGKLSKRYPDQIRAKRSADDDESRLRIHVYPVIGSTPIDRITLDMCEDVMRRIPSTLAVATRRNVGQLITRIMATAVYPMRLITSTPIPTGFLPASPKQKAMAYLYPDEDRRLMACERVPLEYRLLYGVLAREGLRLGEALGLTWGDLDLERGAVRLDKTKTDEARAWALDPAVTDALRRFKRSRRSDATLDAHVFLDPAGRRFTESGALGLPALLRAHLVEIGLHRERPELLTSGPDRRRMRIHDLRATMITVALANGRSEAWISDRTGHKSSVMINRYRRIARTFSELQTGELEPLFRAIPELSVCRNESASTGTNEANYLKQLASPAGFEPASPT